MLLYIGIIIILSASSGGLPTAYYISSSDDIIADNNTCFFQGRSYQPCSTLETLTANYTSIFHHYLGEDSWLSFLPGNYVVKKDIHLNFSSFQKILLSPLKGSAVKIKCNANLTITFWNTSQTYIGFLEFYSCGGKTGTGHVIQVFGLASIVYVGIFNSSFADNMNAIAVYSQNIYITITGSRFENNSNHQCGDISEDQCYNTSCSISIVANNSISGVHSRSPAPSDSYILNSKINITDCVFLNSVLPETSGLLCLTSDGASTLLGLSLTNCIFHNNAATAHAKLIMIRVIGRSGINIYNCIFHDNAVGSIRGLIESSLQQNTIIVVNNTRFLDNRATGSGGGIQMSVTGRNYIVIVHCMFQNNTVTSSGAAIELFQHGISSILITNSIFLKNTAESFGGAIKLSGRSHITISNSTFVANTCNGQGGGVYLNENFPNNGEIMALQNVTFVGNTAAKSGGGIYAYYIPNSKTKTLNFSYVIFRENFASEGGAVFIQNITLILHESSAFISNKANSEDGGALIAKGSKITFAGSFNLFGVCLHNFENNSAGQKGGALFLSKSLLYFDSNHVSFTRNEALLGGALFVKDFSMYCEESNYHQCFFDYSDLYLIWQTEFQENIAEKGSILYGGFLNICDKGSGIQRFTELVSHEIIGDSVTSDPVNICFCDDQKRPNCSMRHGNVSTVRGKTMSLMLTTIDQFKNFKSSMVQYCDDSTVKFSKRKCHHNISDECESINFQVYSNEMSANLILKSKGICKEINKLIVTVSFQPCPRGFQLDSSKSICKCDERLEALLPTVRCNIDATSVQKLSNSWFQYHNATLHVCTYCPLDYCNRSVLIVPTADINESQCANNHAGIICGGCKEFFSIVLGSSLCIECSSARNYHLLWLIPLFAVMGLILVLSILVLDLTVSIGLINGLIFYANILSISGLTNNYNCSIHPLLSVFISWVNLDFGIETCFYSGMDMYQKTWLQFAFPLYIWLLVGLIIILSHYSTRVMRLLGRKVIPVLATLFLLSYAKILKTIITAFDFTIVFAGDAANTSNQLVPRKVWTHDGNVDYLKDKHIPLFIVTLLFLVLLFLPYTLLLIFGQCLHMISKRKKGLRWLRSITFISIMDAYHAPFNKKHRYWTGLLLLIRCILLIIFTSNYKENALVFNTFAVAIVTIGLLVFKVFIKDRIYRNHLADNLENIILLNLVLYATTVVYLHHGAGSNTHRVCPCLTASISMALVIFSFIVVCHISYKVKNYNSVQTLLHKIVIIKKAKAPVNNFPQESKKSETTTTFVELREPLLESI